MVALIAVALVVYALGSVETRYEAMALGGIMGGAVGNLLDRLTRGDGWLDGRVVDWIDLIPWPTFNIADSAITISAAVLVIAALMKR
jgi:signal peptidase II